MPANAKLHTTANHPMVIEALKEAKRELALEDEPIPQYTGGHGVIFLCSSKTKGRFLLKIPSYAGRASTERESLRRRLLLEGKILTEIACPALPSLILIQPHGRFLAREFISGQKLSEQISTTPTVDLQTLSALLRTADMVFKAFHQREGGRYVVRDFKANNLIVPEKDPSLLRLVDIDSTRKESEMVTLRSSKRRLGSGKWLHWSPEQLLDDQRSLDYRTDYFALGVTAYVILTGDNPYSNRIGQPDLVLENYLKEYDDAKSNLRSRMSSSRIPYKIFEFVLQCIHPLPQARPEEINFERLL